MFWVIEWIYIDQDSGDEEDATYLCFSENYANSLYNCFSKKLGTQELRMWIFDKLLDKKVWSKDG